MVGDRRGRTELGCSLRLSDLVPGLLMEGAGRQKDADCTPTGKNGFPNVLCSGKRSMSREFGFARNILPKRPFLSKALTFPEFF